MDSAVASTEMGGLEAQAEVSECLVAVRPLLENLTGEMAALGGELPRLADRVQKAKLRGAVRALKETRRVSKRIRKRSRRIGRHAEPASELMLRLARACVVTLAWARRHDPAGAEKWARMITGSCDTVQLTRSQFRPMEQALIELRDRNIARELNDACDDLLGSLTPFLESLGMFVDDLSRALEER